MRKSLGRHKFLFVALLGLMLFEISLLQHFVWAGQSRSNSSSIDSRQLDEGFVELGNGRYLWVSHRPAEPGYPTLVLLNGLTYSVQNWDSMLEFFHSLGPGVGVLRYDMRGQGASVLKEGWVLEDIDPKSQAQDLRQLHQLLSIEGPIIHLGLSYGGAIALKFEVMYPGITQDVVLVAPYLKALEGQDTWIRENIERIRQLNPYLPWDDRTLYKMLLSGLVYFVYPQAESEFLELPRHLWDYSTLMRNNLRLNGVRRMVNAIIGFEAVHLLPHLKEKKIHLWAPQEDEYVNPDEFFAFWQEMPKKRRASFVRLQGVKHRVQQEIPLEFSELLLRVIWEDPELRKGREIDLWP